VIAVGVFDSVSASLRAALTAFRMTGGLSHLGVADRVIVGPASFGIADSFEADEFFGDSHGRLSSQRNTWPTIDSNT
jgi:hypothetical protein